ncbi:MAG: alpha/beta hydrolase fold domain-containing protein [Actinomycetota bacterium]
MPTSPPLPLPGRLGDPDSTLASDPRSDPRMLAAMLPFGLGGRTPPPRVTPDDSLETRIAFSRRTESRLEGLFDALVADLPPVRGVSRSARVIPGPDGSELKLSVHRPLDASGPLPGILHVHGGGMVMLHGNNLVYSRWREELAASGLVVVGVEFRNAVDEVGHHPFPAGLDDVTAALRWVSANRAEFGITTLVLQGDSGGANLALAATIRAGREGETRLIDGVYASVPYISGLYEWFAEDNPSELPSLTENDGYFMSNALNSILSELYDPDRANHSNPLAWPYFASVEDLRGLPPHAISANELDPCRDEGLAYARTLRAAGVPVQERLVAGVCHFGDTLFAAALPDVYAESVRHVRDFARGL